jgi:dTMP kinase
MREPDMTLWFDLPAEVAAERLATARVPDRFEAQPGEFFARGPGLCRARPDGTSALCAIDAHASRHAVWQQITQAVVRKGWLAIMVGSKP